MPSDPSSFVSRPPLLLFRDRDEDVYPFFASRIDFEQVYPEFPREHQPIIGIVVVLLQEFLTHPANTLHGLVQLVFQNQVWDLEPIRK